MLTVIASYRRSFQMNFELTFINWKWKHRHWDWFKSFRLCTFYYWMLLRCYEWQQYLLIVFQVKIIFENRVCDSNSINQQRHYVYFAFIAPLCRFKLKSTMSMPFYYISFALVSHHFVFISIREYFCYMIRLSIKWNLSATVVFKCSNDCQSVNFAGIANKRSICLMYSLRITIIYRKICS